jgi:hypothetical protein
MRVNRTFSIPIDLVHELKKKPNQSETVTKALRKHLNNEDVVTIVEASDVELINELRLRFGLMDAKSELLNTIKAMI